MSIPPFFEFASSLSYFITRGVKANAQLYQKYSCSQLCIDRGGSFMEPKEQQKVGDSELNRSAPQCSHITCIGPREYSSGSVRGRI